MQRPDPRAVVGITKEASMKKRKVHVEFTAFVTENYKGGKRVTQADIKRDVRGVYTAVVYEDNPIHTARNIRVTELEE